MKEVSVGPFRGQPNKLFQTNVAVDLYNLPRSLEDMGFTLNRAHFKENDGLGSTIQLMLVYEKGREAIQRNKRWEAEHAFFGNTGKREGFLWQTEAFKNGSAGRVPPHVQFKCGNPKEVSREASSLDVSASGAPILNGIVIADNPFEGLTMVRISLNLYPNMRHLIPDWVEERLRHNQRVTEEIAEALGGK